MILVQMLSSACYPKLFDFVPLPYVRSGVIFVDYGALRFPGDYGYNWSNQAHSNKDHAYYIDFHGAVVGSSISSNRFYAFPGRNLPLILTEIL